MRLHVVVNRAGIAQGVYRASLADAHAPDGPAAAAAAAAAAVPALSLRLAKRGMFAEKAQEAALDQAVIGNAAAVLIFSLSRHGIAAAGAAAGRECVS